MRKTEIPYDDISDPRGSLRGKLPRHAQEIQLEAFNNAYDRYKDPDKRRGSESREEAAHRVACSAVEQKYEEGDDGKWHRK